MKNRPPIPSEVTIALRQESGFGCCRCGNPIIEYHHIIPYSLNPCNKTEDMMCLCPNHHKEFSYLPEAEQRKFKQNPLNKARGYLYGKLIPSYNVPVLSFGEVIMVNNGAILSIDKNPILSLFIEDEKLLLSIKIYDKFENLLCNIEKNEWKSGVAENWDFQWKYNYLRLRSSKYKVNFELDLRHEIINCKGNLCFNGQVIKLSDSGVEYINKKIKFAYLGFVGTGMYINSSQKSLSLGKSLIVSEGDKKLRVEKCIKIWNENYKKGNEAANLD